MNAEDPFETRLRGQALRPVPDSWREEILRTAREAARSDSAGARGVSFASRFRTWAEGLLWPSPRAWAGLAALWLVVLGLNLGSPDPMRQQAAERPTPPSLQMRELLRQQEQLLAELVGPLGAPAPARPKPAVPQPRSQRQGRTFNT